MTAATPIDARLFKLSRTISSVMTELGALTSRSLSITPNSNAVPLPRDPAAPDTPVGTARLVTSIDSSISGTFRHHKALQDLITAQIGTSAAMEFEYDAAANLGGGIWAGTYIWGPTEIAGEDGDHLICTVTFELNGAKPTFTAAS